MQLYELKLYEMQLYASKLYEMFLSRLCINCTETVFYIDVWI